MSDKKKRKKGQTVIRKITAVAEKDGWHVNTDTTGKGLVLFEFSKFTPYGQDFHFSAEMKDGDPDTLAESVRQYYESFDPDEEATLWIGPDGHGKRGAPYRIKDIVSDMEAAEDLVYQLYTAINEAFRP